METTERIHLTNWRKTAAEIFSVQWRPDFDTMVAFGSYLLVVAGMVTAFQVFTIDRVAANFIIFGPITLAGLGVVFPVLYTVLKRGRPLSEMGLTSQWPLLSLGLSLLLGWDTYRNTLATLDVTWSKVHVPLISLALTVGLFEAVFFRGWLQLRLEAAFGMLPGILLGALSYALYHVGYGMEVGEMVFLFTLGLTFAAVFRLTKSVLILWPFYTPVGGLFTNLTEGLTLPFEATYGFGITVAMMIGVIVVGWRLHAQKTSRDDFSQW